MTGFKYSRLYCMTAFALLIIVGANALTSHSAFAERLATTTQYKQKIEAGLIYNFLKYTTWPRIGISPEKSRLHVCLFGEDPFNGSLNSLKGRTAQQHIIEILQINAVEEVGNCQLVFIGQDHAGLAPQILSFAQDKSILTVSDMDAFTEDGGMVEFHIEDDQRIHILLNKSVIADAKLTMGDRLLRLAEQEPAR